MNNVKTKRRNVRYLLAGLFGAVLSAAVTLSCVPAVQNAKAFTNSNYTGSGVTTPIYDYANSEFNESALDALASAILEGDPSNPNGVKLNDLIVECQNRGNRGEYVPNSHQLFAFGSYSVSSGKKDLVWEPVYLSTAEYANEGTLVGDAILTIWLAESVDYSKPQSKGKWLATEQKGVGTGGQMANTYGTSLIRSDTLGQPGGYAVYATKGATSYTLSVPRIAANTNQLNTVSAKSAFSEFIQMYDDTRGVAAGTVVDGLFYGMEGVIARPASMSWQEYQSAASCVGTISLINGSNGKVTANPKITTENTRYAGAFDIPNEAWGTTGSQYRWSEYDYPSQGNNQIKQRYSRWKDDTLWLPSFSEVGGGGLVSTKTKANSYSENGLWQTDGETRSNGVGSGGMHYTFLRSAARVCYDQETAGKKSDYARYLVTAITETKGTSTYTYGNIKTNVPTNTEYGVRPAVHLNLSAIARRVNMIDPEVAVETEYNGEPQEFDLCAISNSGWYAAMFDSSTPLEYYHSKDGNPDPTAPIKEPPTDAGDYFVLVTLADNYSWVGFTSSIKQQYIKFTIKPKKVYAFWQYGYGGIPTEIKLSPTATSQTEFTVYDRDAEDKGAQAVRVDWYFVKTGGNAVVDEEGKYCLPTSKGNYCARAYLTLGGREVTGNTVCNYELADDGKDSRPFDYTPTVKIPTFTDGERTKLDMYRSPESEPANDDAGIEAGQAVVYQIANFDSKYIDITSVQVTYGGSAVSSDVVYLTEPIGLESQTYDHIYLVMKSNSNGLNFNAGTYKIVFTMNPTAKVNQFNWANNAGDFNTSIELTLNIQKASAQLLLNKGTSGTSEKSGKQNIAKNDQSKLELEIVGAGTTDANELLKAAKLSLRYGNNTISNVAFTWNEEQGWLIDSTGLDMGTRYSLFVGMSDTQNYKFTSSSYMFYITVVNKAERLDETDIVWQVKSNQTGETKTINDASDNKTTYTGYSYVYTLAIDQKTLDDHGVWLEYMGNNSTDSGVYSAIARVNAVNAAVSPDFESYTIIFDYEIVKSVFDLSEVIWVTDTVDTVGYPTLKDLPAGLKVQYKRTVLSSNGPDIKGSVTAEFIVSSENYKVPVISDTSSYYTKSGEFQFSKSYDRTRTVIEYRLTDQTVVQSVCILPTVIADDANLIIQKYIGTSGELVERFVPGVQYKVYAEVKDPAAYVFHKGNQYVTNVTSETYKIPDGVTTTTQFVVKADGEQMYNGQQFGFTGKPIVFTVESTNGSVAIKSQTRIIDDSDPDRKTLTTAPTKIGKYILIVTVTSVGNYATDINYEIEYEIVRASVKLADIYFTFTSKADGSEIYKVHYLETMGGWYDNLGNLFDWSKIPYLEGGYKISLKQISGVTINISGDVEPLNVTQYRINIEGVNATSSDYDISGITSVFNKGTSIKYSIVEAAFDLSQIRWNIEVGGVENGSRTDFSKPLAYGAGYEYTVKIFGLPAALNRVIRYYTFDANDTAKVNSLSSNTASAQGAYRTYFSIGSNGESTFKAQNYKEVKLDDIKAYLNNSDYLTWSIAYKDTTELKTTTIKFDGEAHDVYDIFALSPVEKATLTKVDIVYNDTTGRQTDNYSGYENQKGMIFHAGKYQVRFSDVSQTIFTNWGTLSVTSMRIAGEWKLQVYGEASYDMFFLYDTYSQYNEFIDVIYTDRYGTTYYGTPGAQSYYTAQVVIKDEYKGDIDLNIANNGGKNTTEEFFYTPWTKGPTSVALPYPTFEQNETVAYFDGLEKRFSVKDFDSVYGQYLNVNGNWVATEIGKYTIIFTFKPGADAYWSGSDDQTPYTLSFEIVKRDLTGLTPVKKPTIEDNTRQYTGEDYEFVVSGLSDKVYIIENSSDALTQKNKGEYWIKVALKNKDSMYWEGTDGEVGDLTLKFYITVDGKQPGVDPNNPDGPVNPDDIVNELKKTIDSAYLSIVPPVQQYTGEELEFTISNWSLLQGYLVIKEGDSLIQTKVHKYHITIGFTPSAILDGWKWADGGTASLTLTFMIVYENEYMQWVNDNTYDPWATGDYTEEWPPVPGEQSNINKIVMYVLIGLGVILLILAIVLAAQLASIKNVEDDYEDDFYEDYGMLYDLNDTDIDTYEETDEDYDYDYGYEGSY